MHIPVLKKEVLEYLDPTREKNIIDCTANGGGHLREILAKGSKVLAIEWDKEIFERLESENLDRVILVNDSYANLSEIVENNNFSPVNGILFDLGMSSWHVDSAKRGFTFRYDQVLDMRFNEDNDLTASIIVNTWSQSAIEKILKDYSEEKRAKIIARDIVKNRPIKTTFKLKDVIGGKRGRIDPATKVFQALRIAVNGELESLRTGLKQAEKILTKEGVLVVISFHSNEDRIVKHFFKDSHLEIITKKPITPSGEELKNNPRSRSAKLRVAIKK